MQRQRPTLVAVIFLLGVTVGAFCCPPAYFAATQPSAALAQPVAQQKLDLEGLQAEIERLKQVVPDQAHAMQDVDYHFTNLWFAASQSNWPLAQFYFNETRSHLRWAV